MLSANWWQPLGPVDWESGGFGLYVHWPFCKAKCPYCDFNSHVSAQVDQSHWGRAFLSELDRVGLETAGRTLNSIFFGGGTPSLMDPDIVGSILDKTHKIWPAANDLEVTLEANPTSVEAGRFRAYRDAGVSRVSMGIQALNDADLRRLGRLHSVEEGLNAFDTARKIFARVSFDLIYARQNQTAEDWRAELAQALSLGLDHLSLYQLTIEEGTAFGDRLAAGGLRGLPSDDLGADLYDITQELCESAGMPAYEVSNHARDMAQSRHNLIYWRCGDYVGIGPGAHGRITTDHARYATETALMPQAWLERIDAGIGGEIKRDEIALGDQAAEYLMMSLRLAEGTNLARYDRLAGESLDAVKLCAFIDEGFLVRSGSNLCATSKGRPLLNAILRELMVV